MYKNKFRSIIFALLLALIIPNFVIAEAQSNPTEMKADLIFFEEVLDYIKESYPFEVDESKLIEAALKGMLQSIDPYSNYYTVEESSSVYKNLLGTFSGVGIYIEEKDGYINVKDTIKNQPAEKAGVKKDDLIISVDDKDIKGIGLEKVSSMIQGLKGTKVKLGIQRGDKIFTFEIVRDTITITPVHYQILENKIGYLQIDEFNTQTTQEVKKALNEFDMKNITKVILDLRNNPGGQLNQAISVSKMFVPKGAIVHIREKNKDLVTHTSTLDKSKYKLVVLVNENSASASEIVAGAIKDRKAGTLVGVKTFGKGIVQSLIPIEDGSLIKLTTAEYLTPNKISIHGKGIDPDIKVENTAEEDLQIKKAIEILK